jgi:hypothetical protein
LSECRQRERGNGGGRNRGNRFYTLP